MPSFNLLRSVRSGLAAVLALVFSAQALAETAQPSLEQRVAALEAVRMTGSVRLNYTVKDWDAAQTDRGGDFTFNQINLGVEAEHGGVRLSSQYRWYDNGNGAMVHHAYFATDLNEATEVQLGITKVPFGILPYESRSYWGDAALYLGFNDDYDSGIKLLNKSGNWDLQIAYFASGDAAPDDAQRFSFDVVSDSTDGGQQNQETHQFNLRAAYALNDNAEVGASLQMGGLYNETTGKMGNVAAGALHYTATYGKFGVQSEVIRYSYNPENEDGVSDNTIQMGGFGATYMAAAQANLYVLNLSYDLPWTGGIVDMVQLFNDWNLMDKNNDSFRDSQINTLGLLVATGNLYTNFDITSARNVPFIGAGDYKTAFAEGDGKDGWQTFFNVQLGYYF